MTLVAWTELTRSKVEAAKMLTVLIAFCNVAIGGLLAVVVALVAKLFFSGQAGIGIVFAVLVFGVVAFVVLLDWFDARIWRAFRGWIGLPKWAQSSTDAGDRHVYWGAVGFGLGLTASAIWTPGAVLGLFRWLVN